MKINILTEGQKEEIIFPSKVFALGLEYNGMTVVNGIEILFPNVTADRKEITLSNDNELTVISYFSNDESYYRIMAKYKHMKFIEFKAKNIEIIITI